MPLVDGYQVCCFFLWENQRGNAHKALSFMSTCPSIQPPNRASFNCFWSHLNVTLWHYPFRAVSSALAWLRLLSSSRKMLQWPAHAPLCSHCLFLYLPAIGFLPYVSSFAYVAFSPIGSRPSICWLFLPHHIKAQTSLPLTWSLL